MVDRPRHRAGVTRRTQQPRAAVGDDIGHTALGARHRAALDQLEDLFLAEGVTTVEIKSGYGLDTASELKMLEVARALAERLLELAEG